MKIAYVYDAVYPWETGGVQKRVWELARRLAGDHDVHWYGMHYWDGPPVRERDGVTLHGVCEPRELYVDGRRSITQALSFSAQLVRPLLGQAFDVVDCQEFPYFPCFPSKLCALAHDSTLFVTWHEVWDEYWYEYLGRKGAFGKAIESVVARLPDEHIVVSARTQREFEGLGVQTGHLVPNGISMNEIELAPEAADPIDVLFVGRLIPEKNPELVVRAVALLVESVPDFRCYLVGEGPERAAVERLTADLNLEDNVDVLGFRDSHAEVLGLMKAADVFVLPSRREGFGITVLEALACGTPVVTVHHPQNAAEELVEDGENGYVTAPMARAIAEAVSAARTTIDPEACTASAREYDWDELARRTETVYRNAY